MRSDVGDLCKDARERIAVPTVPLAAIRSAAAYAVPKNRNRRSWVVATLLAGSSLLAAAVSAQVWNGTRFSINQSGGFMLQFDDRPTKMQATSANLRSAAGRADFPVVLPAGLPRNATLVGLGRIGSSVIMLAYNVPNAGHRDDRLGLWLVNSEKNALSQKGAQRRPGYEVELMNRPGLHWKVGGEEVVVTAHGALSDAQLAHIKDAMIAKSRRGGRR